MIESFRQKIACHRQALTLYFPRDKRDARDIAFDTVFASSGQLRAGALVIGPDPLFVARSEQLAALALRHAVPAICLFALLR
jgi:putative ABC transport system substrate-binding protein